MTWWTDYQARRGQDRKTLFTDNMKNLVSTEFENSTSYELVKISGFDRKTRIVEESSIIKNPNRKRLLCFPDETISIGEIVEFDNSNWICVNGETTSKISDVGIIERCNNVLKFYDSTSTLHQIPCIISKGSISLDEQKIISTLDSEIVVQISNTSITRQIPMSYVFKLGMRNYSVTDINDITVNGLLLIKMVYSEVEQQIPTYTISILNGTSIRADKNNTLQLNVQVKSTVNNITTIISPNPELIFNSSNDDIGTVNSSGLCTFYLESSPSWDLSTIVDEEMILDLDETYELTDDGKFLLSDLFGSEAIPGVVVSVKLASDLDVVSFVNIDVYDVPMDNYTLEISGSASIIKTYSSTYTCVFRNNGVAITDTSVFYLTGDDGVSATNLASIISQDIVVNTCVVKGLGLGYVKLWVKNVDETIVSEGLRIQIKSLF